MAQFPRPDPATQGILGIRDVTARLVNGAYKSVYACTLVIDGTEAVVSVEAPPLEEAAVLDRLASQPPNPHVVSVLARYDAADAEGEVGPGGVPTTLVFHATDEDLDFGDCFDHLVVATEFGVDELHAYLEEYPAAVETFMKPTDMFGKRVMGVLDPNGYRIVISN